MELINIDDRNKRLEPYIFNLCVITFIKLLKCKYIGIYIQLAMKVLHIGKSFRTYA